MDRSLHLKTILLGTVILLLFAYVGGVLIARERLENLRSELQVQASMQQTLLTAIAEATARNGADETTEKIVKDCAIDERTTFDALLGQLDKGLSQSELLQLERLFGRCGSFYSERKSVMVARLSREVEVYENYIKQLEKVGFTNIESYNLTLWKQLAEDERKQSETFNLLVVQQDNIISSLIEGKNPSSIEVARILDDVKSTQQALAEINTEASEKRSVLISM